MLLFHLILVSCIIVCSSQSPSQAELSGPFFIWGGNDLSTLRIPALEAINTKHLHDKLSKTKVVILYTRRSSTELNQENYPELSKIVDDHSSDVQWLYLPQSSLSVESDLFKIEIFPHTSDKDIISHFKTAQDRYKDVIGILAVADYDTQVSDEHFRSKREYKKKPFIFAAHGQGILVTHVAPILNNTKDNTIHELKNHGSVRYESTETAAYDEIFRLIVPFVLADKSEITLKFIFKITVSGYWEMTHVEYENHTESTKYLMYAKGKLPSAPLYVSYACNGTFIFKAYELSLILKNIQVQPRIDGGSRFDDAWDCNSYMTIGILSGLLVSLIFIFILSIAVTALMNIKTR